MHVYMCARVYMYICACVCVISVCLHVSMHANVCVSCTDLDAEQLDGRAGMCPLADGSCAFMEMHSFGVTATL